MDARLLRLQKDLGINIGDETVALFVMPPPAIGAVIAIVSVASCPPNVMTSVFVQGATHGMLKRDTLPRANVKLTALLGRRCAP